MGWGGADPEAVYGVSLSFRPPVGERKRGSVGHMMSLACARGNTQFQCRAGRGLETHWPTRADLR